MRKYKEIAKIYLKTQFVWRTDVVVQMILTVTKIMFAYLLWGIIFKQKDSIAGFTFQGMLSYYIISSFLSQLDLSGKISEDMTNRIRGGTMSNFLVLPVNVRRYYIAMEAGMVSFYIGFDLLAMFLWVILFRIHFAITNNLAFIGMAVMIEALGMYFIIQLNYYLGILTLKYEEISTFLMIKNNLMSLVTGSIIPLALFPEQVLKIMKLLPFYYVTYLPAMLLSGRCGEDAISGVVILLAWILGFSVLIRRSFKKYRLKYDGVGI